MNLLLLGAGDLCGPGRAAVRLDRYPPRADWWPPPPGRELRVGLRDGPTGHGRVTALTETHALIDYALDADPPAALPLTLLLALPRPKMLRRVLRCAAELGIKRIVLMNAWRVDKSYWKSPLLEPAALERCLAEGLEQACDTRMPELLLRPRLKPFVEDELPAFAGDTRKLLAHPAGAAPLCAAGAAAVTLAIGPEGGFSDYEVGLFGACGFSAVRGGARILRVETALPVLAATLFPFVPASV